MIDYALNLLENDWVKGVLIFVAIYCLVSFIGWRIKKRVHTSVPDIKTRATIRKLINIVTFVLLTIAFVLIFLKKMSGLSVAIGVMGAGITFALQEVITSIAGWFAINFGSFFRVGDRVMLGGIKGDVVDVGMLRTTVMELGEWVKGEQYNGRVVRIANSFVFKDPVFNYSVYFPFLWDEIDIPIKYGSDLKAARNLIKNIADETLDDYETKASQEWRVLVEKFDIENAIIDNQVFMTADSNAVTFSLRYVCDYKSRRKTKDILFEKIVQQIADHKDIEIAGASMEITTISRNAN